MSRQLLISYTNYEDPIYFKPFLVEGRATSRFQLRGVKNFDYESQYILVSGTNYQFNVQPRTCKKQESVTRQALNKTYNLKTSKFLTLNESAEVGFDIDGYFLDEENLKRMYENTPDYFIQPEEEERGR